MDLNKLYEKQAKLDKYILENNWAREGKKMSKEELLDNTILALLVEIGELANATRCFKHWSRKGPESKDRILEELADTWHFYISIGNQIECHKKKFEDGEIMFNKAKTQDFIFKRIYYWTIKFDLEVSSPILVEIPTHNFEEDSYQKIGDWIKELSNYLGFTDKEVEQAYLKKHEENYKRQREGY